MPFVSVSIPKRFIWMQTTIVLIFICAISPTALAYKTKLAPHIISGIYLTESEYMSLPAFLKAKVRWHIGAKSSEYKKWSSKLGPDYQHYHHWAAAMVKFSRALYWNQRKNLKNNLKYVLGEYNYLLKHCQKNNRFRFLFHFKKGEIYIILNDYNQAVQELQQSIKYKNNYAPAYVKLSNAFSLLGMMNESERMLGMAKNLRAH